MLRTAHCSARSILCFALLACVAQPALAQRGGGGWTRFFLQPPVALAQLEEVQKELKLTDEQKEQATKLNEKLNEDRMAIFQDSGGDRAKMRAAVTKLYAKITKEFEKELEEPQQKRLHEIYVQVNGPMALQSDAVANALELTEEQKEKITEALDESRQEFFNAGLRDLGEEEAAKKIDELIAGRDKKLLAALTDEQRDDFKKMAGKKLKVDLSKLAPPRR